MWDIEATTALLRHMSEASDPHELLRLILDHAQRTMRVERAVVLSREGLESPLYRVVLRAERGALDVLQEEQGFAHVGGVLADLLYAGRFRTITALSPDRSDPAFDLLSGHSTLTAFPIFERGRSVRMVALLGPKWNDCNASELCMLAVMGALLQRADRAHALTKQLETTCRTLDAELAAAASVQRWLLPPPAPPTAGVGVATFYRPALHCGGDYYDGGPLPDGKLGVVIADVSGHGAAAAVLMAILRTKMHDEVDRFRVASPAALLNYANQHFCAIGLPSRGAFITAFSGILDPQTGRFTYSCAGHPPPRLRRAADGAVTPIAGASLLPLGILDDSRHAEETVQLEPGDLLVFYTDGITEAHSPTGELFGTARLDRVLIELPRPASADAAVQAIKQAVEAFAGPAAPTDDQTLLAVRWQPDRAAPHPGAADPQPQDPATESETRP